MKVLVTFVALVAYIVLLTHARPLATSIGSSKLSGVCYSPFMPNEGCRSSAGIDADIAQLSTLASSLRIYGLDCDYATIISSAKKYGLTILIGLWVDSKWTDTVHNFESYLSTKPDLSHVIGIIVGNEAITSQSDSEDGIVAKINQIRNLLVSSVYGNIPVGTSEIFVRFSQKLVDASDILVPNIHAFFDSKPFAPFLVDAVYEKANQMAAMGPGKRVLVGETGWPSQGSPLNGAIPSPDAQFEFIKNLLCTQRLINGQQMEYYYFEAYDAMWKPGMNADTYESHFGLASIDRVLKPHITGSLSC